VFYGIGILLVSNLVFVAWVVALRGGRLDLTATPSADDPSAVARRPGRRPPAAAGRGLIGSAVVHAARRARRT
jgi:hypothetical protein